MGTTAENNATENHIRGPAPNPQLASSLGAAGPTPAIRVPHWEQILASAILAARDRPFAWGQHDCATWAFDLRRDLTGGPDHAALWRGRYRTAGGCLRVLRHLGWATLEAGGRALLGAPLADPRLAQRGDLVLGGASKAFGVVAGAQAVFVSPDGLVSLPLSTCRLAWRT